MPKNRERIDVLEDAWEVFIDQLAELRTNAEMQDDEVDRAFSFMKEKIDSMQRDIDILREELMELQGAEDPVAKDTNTELLDGLEFEDVKAAEDYARVELAKGGRVDTIRRWLEDYASDQETESDNE
jgi:hypothetical protein